MRRSDLAALIHGPAELLPVSSSAHAELLGDRSEATGLHLGSAAALVVGLRGALLPRHLGMHLLAGAIPSAIGWPLRGRAWSPVPGLLLGSAALVWADARPGTRQRRDAGWRDGLALGLAQACALVPGVSRNGATLVAGRALGFAQPEANALSREVGLPVTLGAVAVGGKVQARPVAISFLATLVALPLLRVADRAPLWPWALYRCGLALALMRGSER
jgi:undecaprenyl-diphosphatase